MKTGPACRQGRHGTAKDLLNLLPDELLLAIFANIDPDDTDTWVHLLEYNGRLRKIVLADFLFKTDAARFRTLHYACSRGKPDLLRIALETFQMSPSSYLMPRSDDVFPSKGSKHHGSAKGEARTVSTLSTAVRNDHLDIASMLLDLDQERVLNPSGVSMRAFAHSFLNPEHVDFFRMLLDIPFGRAFINYHFASRRRIPRQSLRVPCTLNGSSLYRAVEIGMPVQVIRHMLEEMDGQKTPQGHSHIWLEQSRSEKKNMLVLALESREPEALVPLLVKHGLSVHGYRVSSLFKRLRKRMRISHSTSLDIHSLHTIPIHAAAKHFATTGSSKLLDLCLKHGADINQEEPALVHFGHSQRSHQFGRSSQSSGEKYCKMVQVSPLHVYLLSIPWLSPPNIVNPIGGIEYFLSRGVALTPSRVKRVCTPTTKDLRRIYCHFDGSVNTLSPAELLLAVTGSNAMGHGVLHETVKFLVENGCDLANNESAVTAYDARRSKTEDMARLYRAIRRRQFSLATEMLQTRPLALSSEVADALNLGLLHRCLVAHDPAQGLQLLTPRDKAEEEARNKLLAKLVGLEARVSESSRIQDVSTNGPPLLFAALAQDKKCMQILLRSRFKYDCRTEDASRERELQYRAGVIATLLELELGHTKQDVSCLDIDSVPWQLRLLTEYKTIACDVKGKRGVRWCCPLGVSIRFARERGYMAFLAFLRRRRSFLMNHLHEHLVHYLGSAYRDQYPEIVAATAWP
ncbi:Ankyrin repeat-containing domain protein [Metarhizium rileyi]|uniref:Ankyrin repeat-containing domain protein n=1 Tax=Metarhizium rileyi (strain RCEF 4871) TaxID=1649241 RepID=A0A167F4M8_METRR|nr:Ankyrin repeat-containing domain protein [Metarhizium rileyi RCEF 4871]